MNIKQVTKWVQQSFGITVDGLVGPTTLAMLDMTTMPREWTPERRIVGFFQFKATENGFEPGRIDGYLGPQTENAWNIMIHKEPAIWRNDEGLGGDVKGKWPLQTQIELNRFYGPVGINQKTVTIPFPHKIAWAPERTVTRVTCHEKVAESYLTVLENVLDHYQLEGIQRLHLDMFGGCLNVRKMRGGSNYSTHSWGIAFDYDPSNNRLRWGKDKAEFAKPEYNMWWKCWEDQGAVSLGRTRNYDFMHTQFCRIN